MSSEKAIKDSDNFLRPAYETKSDETEVTMRPHCCFAKIPPAFMIQGIEISRFRTGKAPQMIQLVDLVSAETIFIDSERDSARMIGCGLPCQKLIPSVM